MNLNYNKITFQSIVVISTILFIGIMGCSNINSPNTINTTGNGCIYGNVWLLYAFPIYYSNDSVEIAPRVRNNTLVQVIGTALSTTTDSIGNWKLSGLDSGAYSIHFTHEGYDTLTLSNIRTNGHDSNEVKITPYGGVFLAEYIKPVFDTVYTTVKYQYWVDHLTNDTSISGQYIECIAKTSVNVLGNKDASYEVLIYSDSVPTVSNSNYLAQEATATPRFNKDSVYFTIRSSKLLERLDSKGLSIGLAHNKDIYFRLYPKVSRRNKFEILPPSKVYHVRIP